MQTQPCKPNLTFSKAVVTSFPPNLVVAIFFRVIVAFQYKIIMYLNGEAMWLTCIIILKHITNIQNEFLYFLRLSSMIQITVIYKFAFKVHINVI